MLKLLINLKSIRSRRGAAEEATISFKFFFKPFCKTAIKVMKRHLALILILLAIANAKSIGKATDDKVPDSGKAIDEATTIISTEPKPIEFKTFKVLPNAEDGKVVEVKEKSKKSRQGKKPRKQLANIRVLKQDEVEQSNAQAGQKRVRQMDLGTVMAKQAKAIAAPRCKW